MSQTFSATMPQAGKRCNYPPGSHARAWNRWVSVSAHPRQGCNLKTRTRMQFAIMAIERLRYLNWEAAAKRDRSITREWLRELISPPGVCEVFNSGFRRATEHVHRPTRDARASLFFNRRGLIFRHSYISRSSVESRGSRGVKFSLKEVTNACQINPTQVRRPDAPGFFRAIARFFRFRTRQNVSRTRRVYYENARPRLPPGFRTNFKCSCIKLLTMTYLSLETYLIRISNVLECNMWEYSKQKKIYFRL